MTNPADRLAAEFDRLADDPQAPVSTVDFDRALADGRRTVRTRRRRVGLSGVGALALAVLIAVPMLAAGNAPPGQGVGGTDPLSAYADFGWLPVKLTGTMYSEDVTDDLSETIAYNPQLINNGGMSAEARLLFSADADAPGLVGAGTIGHGSSQIGTLNGYPVTMRVQPYSADDYDISGGIGLGNTCGNVSSPLPGKGHQDLGSHGKATVSWHTADGGVALIDYTYVNQPAPDPATMLHMAQTVTVDRVPLPVPLPLSISGLAGVPVSFAANGYRAGQPSYVGLEFVKDGVLLEILVNVPADAHVGCGDTVSTHSASQSASRIINGLTVTVRTTSKNYDVPVDLDRFGTPAQILDKITSFGPDPAKWTTNVIMP